MTERIFESAFHKKYVRGEGGVMAEPVIVEPRNKTRGTTEEEVLSQYRSYIGDPSAELPEEIRRTVLSTQRTENDGNTPT